VLHIATRSRGWEDPDAERRFKEHFKIDPLFQASALALLRKAGQLVGIAGCVRNWRIGNSSLVHMCSLGFLPTIQSRGLLRMLMGLLWEVCWNDPTFRNDANAGTAYATAITQSPFLMAYFDHLFELYPSPDRAIIDTVADVAQAVVDRFDPHLHLERDTLVLRNEAQFFYKQRPYSGNERINAFCDRTLRYEEGDVFVAVGRVIADRIEQVLRDGRQHYPQIVALTGISR
jgi:hypothetical protein